MENNDKKWIINGSKEVFKGKIFTIDELDCYLPSRDVNNNFVRLKLADWVNVFALTDDNKVIMVRQHRLGKDIVSTEVPAGAIDKGEEPLDAAKRELEEETGYTSDNIFLLQAVNVNPAIQDNVCYFYFADNCKKTKDTNFDATEELETHFFSLNEVVDVDKNLISNNSVSFLSIMLGKDFLMRNNRL